MSESPIIGIDLGTTFSCVSVYRKGKAELIPNAEGDRLTPSIVYFDPDNGEVSVGQTAYELSPQCPKNALLDAKRFIGRKFDDEFISRYIKRNQVHFSLVPGEDDQAAFEIDISGTKIIKKPEEVSAQILKYLKNCATEYLGKNITKAVISVPAYFSNAQRKATKKAGELAGLTVSKLITEPTAAAIHYVSDNERVTSNILAFDFGGGTLDVSLIKVDNNTFEVKAVYGDTLLGGRNFDELLYEHFYKEFLNSTKKNLLDRNVKGRLNESCVNLKKKLSTKNEFTLFIDKYDGNTGLSISMTKDKFEEISKDIFKRIMEVVELCLYDSGFSKADIKNVILVGGSTRIPKVRQLLTSYFGSAIIKTDLNPDEAVAAGASIHAAFLQGNCKDLERYKVTEVTPMSLGLSISNGLMKIYIPKNSPLPANAFSNLQTSYNDQSEVIFPIFEGERKDVSYNNKLGEFVIENLPKGRSGDVKFNVNLNLDENGILSVKAQETWTGKSNKLTVTMGQFRLSEKKIISSLEEARKYKLEDDMFEHFKNTQTSFKIKCQWVLYDINKILFEEDRDFVRQHSEQFLSESDELTFKEIDKLKQLFREYNNSVSRILNKYSIHHLTE